MGEAYIEWETKNVAENLSSRTWALTEIKYRDYLSVSFVGSVLDSSCSGRRHVVVCCERVCILSVDMNVLRRNLLRFSENGILFGVPGFRNVY
jgi:hypothetical protein